MAPFPEDEIMTIKRLEVALRKSDFKQLQEGAYKLHEKYHSHHRFIYTDMLKDILEEVKTNYAIPSNIKDILVPTIEDILSDSEGEYQNDNQNRVSSLTSLSYGLNNQSQKPLESETKEYRPQTLQPFEKEQESQQEYIKPFQEFTPIKPIELTESSYGNFENTAEQKENFETSKSIIDSFSEQPAEDFDTGVPYMKQQNIFENTLSYEPQQVSAFNNDTELKEAGAKDEFYTEPAQSKIEYFVEEESSEEVKEEAIPEYTYETKEPISQSEYKPYEEIIEEKPDNETTEEVAEEIYEEQDEELESKEKSIAIFFGQDFSNEKIKNISKYRELIHAQGNFSLNEITSLINEIKTQSDTNVSELQIFLDKLKIKNHNINLITNSQSANLIDLFNQNDITYSIFNPSDDKKFNLLPLFGLTNLHKCLECDSEYLETNEKVNSFILQCPKCKKAMLPDLYSPKGELNMDYYNSALIAFANSDTWLLIHPSLNDKLTLNMIRSAMKVSSGIKEVYILDKDINVRETYKKLLTDINPNIEVKNDLNTVEYFLSSI